MRSILLDRRGLFALFGGMNDIAYRIETIAGRPDLIETADHFCGEAWPEFMLHDPVVDEHWMKLYEQFPEYQCLFLAPDSDNLIAVGNSLPLAWEGTPENLPDGGLDWILQSRFGDDPPEEAAVVSQFALQIVVNPDYLGRRLSSEMVKALTGIGREQNHRSLFAPVRPNHKHRYPLTPMERYIDWTTSDSLPFDPWLRVHARLGAEIIRVCPEAMHIYGTVAEWEAWTGMRFPDSGSYVVPGALVPVLIDVKAARGLYIEPNVWMHHRIS